MPGYGSRNWGVSGSAPRSPSGRRTGGSGASSATAYDAATVSSTGSTTCGAGAVRSASIACSSGLSGSAPEGRPGVPSSLPDAIALSASVMISSGLVAAAASVDPAFDTSPYPPRRPPSPSPPPSDEGSAPGEGAADLARDEDVLPRGDYEAADGGARGTDLGVRDRGVVARRVEPYADEPETLCRRGPDRGGVLAHAGREHQHVEPADRGAHRGDRRAQPVHVDVEREPAGGLAGRARRDDLAHVGGAGEGEQPGAVLERLGDRGRRDPHTLLP